MNFLNFTIFFFFLIILNGCAELPGHISAEETNKYTSLEQLLSKKLGVMKDETYSVYLVDNITWPRMLAEDYCIHQDKGNLVQVKKFNEKKLYLPDYKQGRRYSAAEVEVFQKDRKNSYNEITRSFGDFECKNDEQTLWGITITHTGTRNDGYKSIRSTDVLYTVNSAYQVSSKKMTNKLTNNVMKQLAKNIQQKQLPIIRTVGTNICRIEYSNIGEIKYFGQVNQVSDSKVQINILQATMAKAPNLSPSGFKPYTLWDYPENWSLCN